jgi:hypothetical protein
MSLEQKPDKDCALGLIQERKARNSDGHRNYYPREKASKLPHRLLPKPVQTLFESPSLWIINSEDGLEYTSSALVKAFFVRKNGQKIDENGFSVFIADSKRYIAERWGITPKSAWNKQRNQYWDKKFVKAMFTRIVCCEKSSRRNVNKIAYEIREDITTEEMESIFLDANTKAIKKPKK